MDAREIYRKSEKGAEAIAVRAHGVSGKLRTLLILVDGKKDVEELTRLAVGLGESPDLLQQLEDEGLIESLSAAAAAAADSQTTDSDEAGEVDFEIDVDDDNHGAGFVRADLDGVRPLATRLLGELLGSTADELVETIERARDVPQFVEAVKRAYVVVWEVRGQSEAERFGEEVEARMPTG